MYYLHLERFFIGKYKEARAAAAGNNFPEESLFLITGLESFDVGKYLKTFGSYSIWPFYIFQVAALILILWVIR